MTNFKNIYKLFAASLVFSGILFSSCDNDDIMASPVNEEHHVVTNQPVAFTVNSNNKASNYFVEFRDENKAELFLSLTKPTSKTVEAEYYYDVESLSRYNEVKGTKYIPFPEEFLTLSNDGKVVINSTEQKSSALEVLIKSSSDLDSDITYVIPLSAKLLGGEEKTRSSSESIKVGKAAGYFIYVRDLTKLPDATKPPYTDSEGNITGPAIKIISCMEVNDTNPLNNLSFTLKKTGKPLVDIVILFSGNINYNAETGRVFNHNNPNVQHLLDNKEKYLKPLQDRGIKVLLGILGNHDVAGVSSLADDTARAFAQELKAVCDAYNLDGIFWDDEYSKSNEDNLPGFTYGNQSRLVYETKKAMPDKMNAVYAFGSTSRLSNVDGVKPSDYIDWAIDDYGGYASGSYGDIKNSQWAVYSQEYNNGRNLITSPNRLTRIRTQGYGGHMIFAMDPTRRNYSSQLKSMQAIAKEFFDDELVVNKPFYSKDW